FLNESVTQIGDEFNTTLKSLSSAGQDEGQAAYNLAIGKGYSKAKANRLANEARQVAAQKQLVASIQIAMKYGILSAPQLNAPGFIAQVVFQGGKAAGTPKARF